VKAMWRGHMGRPCGEVMWAMWEAVNPLRPGGIRAGFEAAYSVGARVDFKKHFLDGADWRDKDGYVGRMRQSEGGQIW
jgi:hypothetical protein